MAPYMLPCMPHGEMFLFRMGAVISTVHGYPNVAQNLGVIPVVAVGAHDTYGEPPPSLGVAETGPSTLPAHLRMLTTPGAFYGPPPAPNFVLPENPEAFFREYLPAASDVLFQSKKIDNALSVGRLLGGETLVYLLGLGKIANGYNEYRELIDTSMMSEIVMLGSYLEEAESTPYFGMVRKRIAHHIAAGTSDINLYLYVADSLPEFFANRRFVERFGRDLTARISEKFHRDVDAFIDQIFKLDAIGLVDAIGIDRIIEARATRVEVLTNIAKLAQYVGEIASLPDDKKNALLKCVASSERAVDFVLKYEVVSRHGFEGSVDLLPLLISKDVESARMLFGRLGVEDEAVVERWARLFNRRILYDHDDELMEIRFILAMSDLSSIHAMASHADSDDDLPIVVNQIKTHRLIENLSDQYDVPLERDLVAEYAASLSSDEISIAIKNTLGALGENEAFRAVITRFKQLKLWLGTTAVHRMRRTMPNYEIRAPLAIFQINDRYRLHLELGNYESYTGMQFAIYEQGDDPWRVAYYKKGHLAAVGFVETDDGIAITRLQGGKDLGSKMERFRKFSGGLSPIAWLTYSVGRILLNRAVGTGKTLRVLNGKQALYLYPHKRGHDPEGIDGMSDALAYIKDKPDKSDRSESARARRKEHRRVMDSIGLYNSTAKRLGFKKGPKDGDSQISPWYVFDTSQPSMFGGKFLRWLDGRGDVGIFQRSVKAFETAFSSPLFGSLKEYDPEWVIRGNARLLPESENPFPGYFKIK